MDNQKDMQKTPSHNPLSGGGNTDVRNDNPLQNKPIYEYANKKTEKLVTALYMITDCMDTEDALKGKLRELAVNLLSDIYKLPIISPVEKHSTITLALTHINEIHAFVEIAHTIGFVSEMNARILKKEFSLLSTELHSYQDENQGSSFGGILFESKMNSSFELSPKMFEIDESVPQIKDATGASRIDSIKDNNGVKRTVWDMSFTSNDKKNLSLPKPKKFIESSFSPLSKKDRSEKILALIKDKKDIAIKDIIYAFTDCSEKTIQRELNTLVLKRQIKKIGAKRWSRYQTITN